ncbi:pleiotropic regulatory protein [Parachlamydia acanthamoebae UV-7]|uniref:Pleiotropic regulatory protein n=2 Tax=Parachlamydia acanthamoebae TaxID=83552 RepID=F8L294_PARAV|nr:DegT/DnrJ/EryC1/StrS family aminotransferase [Parachlamydia acanthamoebae]CCB84965.1 pleiotropic regulatory protein [Parachlamydia acanthamoebae UV-7]
MEFIDIKKQYQLYKKEIDLAIHEVLDQGNFIMGEQVRTLESTLAQYTNTKHCITVSSGTDSLQIALMALGVGFGDEVITVPFTWISSTEVIGLVGATPVFVDIEDRTYNIDVEQLEKAITPKTKAILPVSLFGQMPDYTAINEIAHKYGLPVIEDGAQSFGATQHGRKSCSVTTIGSTSFFPAKPLGCYGDGGALFTNDDTLAAKMRAIRTHGGERRHHHTCLGMNGRLDTMQAAILLAKFPHFDQEAQARASIGHFYSQELAGYCVIPEIQAGNTHVYAQYTIRTPERDELAKYLQAKGVPTGIYYPKCVHEQPVFKPLGYARGSMPVAEKMADEVISLPMHPWLTEEDQHHIINMIKEFCCAPAAC